jgi:hypothetical protein
LLEEGAGEDDEEEAYREDLAGVRNDAEKSVRRAAPSGMGRGDLRRRER